MHAERTLIDPTRRTAESAAAFERWSRALLAQPTPRPRLTEAGVVTAVGHGVVVVSGLARALADELVLFASGVQGVVLDLEPDRLGVVLLGPAQAIRQGEEVHRTHKVVSVPVGMPLLGRVLDALGEPLDDRPAPRGTTRRPVECAAPRLLERAPITRALATGVKAVDAAIPIGRGQRQLVIGDRQTGKTALAVDAILNQRRTEVLCIYCAIGQRGDAVARVIRTLHEGGMRERSIVLHTGDEEAPGLAYVAPYAAMSMAEHFALHGRDVLVVFDDMTHHARAYRELSLLLRRPPGREAFPGDIFYLHARLLERAGQWNERLGRGSITALALVETEAENLSAYIPTNLISITDGQIYLSPRQVRRNQFPAVDLGLSVSRVGGKAQHPALREVAASLRVTLSQFEELEDFARFGTRLDASVRARLARGAALRAALRQRAGDPMSTWEQLALLVAAMEGVFDTVPEVEMDAAMARMRAVALRQEGELGVGVAAGQRLTAAEREALLALARANVLPGHAEAPAPGNG